MAERGRIPVRATSAPRIAVRAGRTTSTNAPYILISTEMGWRSPRASIDAYRASLVAIPSRLLSERPNVQQSQLGVVEDIRFPVSPILVVTGTHDVDRPHDVDMALVD